MSGLNKGLGKVEVALKWDPSPSGEPDHDLDIIAATYPAHDPYGTPSYLVHFDSRSPDGTITLNRDSRTGQGFGFDEVMILELDRLATTYVRVVVGVAVQQQDGRKPFGAVPNTAVRVLEGRSELVAHDFSGVSASTAATVAEFTRDDSGAWRFHPSAHAFVTDPATFAARMGSIRTV
ncbi:TerD family protein [Streptomyces albireticuli]|uniref:TerD family protein n=1 Tax=Streptomyces albireticuli TaxID=1940 RepID=UPI0036BA057C